MVASPHFPSYDVFGAKITPMTSSDLLGLLEAHIAARRQCVVASQNMHGLRVRLAEPSMRRLHDLDHSYVHIDGMPLIALCRFSGVFATRAHRVTLVDFVWPLLTLAERQGWRVYYLGGGEDMLAAGSACIRARLPQLALRTHHGFIEDASAPVAVAKEIADFAPDLVLVGMGMGRQERWILQNLDSIAPASVMTVGACMEYIAGAVGTPPRWMGRAGLEWLYRLAENPARFWQRYLLEPWVVLGHVLHYAAFRRGSQLALERERPN
jgi:N-acetylglucosaminyldiphosphoundecaprenol N-acetyl-beta-D-mannosaminyltransferase